MDLFKSFLSDLSDSTHLGAQANGHDRWKAEPEISFAGFRLEADGTLLRGETVIHLPPKELAALRLLLAHPGQIVTPLQLREALWGTVHVTDDSVPKCVSSLRARLEPEECIQTVYKRGYRFSAEIGTPGKASAKASVNAFPRLVIPPFSTEYSVPEHLGSALAEEIIARLSNMRHSSLSVLARDSVFALALRGHTAQQIGEILKADFALTGTLRALPAHFRLRAEMIRVEDGAQIWVEDMLVPRSLTAGMESDLVSRLAFRLRAAVHGDGPSTPAWQTGVPADRSPSVGCEAEIPGDAPVLQAAPAAVPSRSWNSAVSSIAVAVAEKP